MNTEQFLRAYHEGFTALERDLDGMNELVKSSPDEEVTDAMQHAIKTMKNALKVLEFRISERV